MPICTLHLLALSAPLSHFLTTLSHTSPRPLTVAVPLRWIVLPTTLFNPPLNIHWDVLLILPTAAALAPSLLPLISHHWSLQAGVPSRVLENYAARNKRLLDPQKGDVPSLTGSLEVGKRRMNRESAQGLELSDELLEWIEGFTESGKEGSAGAVSMLNLLSFAPGKKEEYLKYGKAFAESAGSRRGGEAKIVGSVISQPGVGEGETGRWDEIALAHYPSLWHFADMLASEEYQSVNHRWRLGSLKDTGILCVKEVGWDGLRGQGEAKL